VKRAGQDLGARYIVEGSVRKAGSRVRITVQLVDTSTGNHLWAERYDRDLQDIFAIQDEVVTTIVARLARQVASAGLETARRKRTDNLAAYDYLLRGMEHLHRSGDGDIERACGMFERAIGLDPSFAEAHAGLAVALTSDYWKNAYRDPSARTRLDRALEAANRAVALDPNDATCHRALAHVHLCRRSFDLADHHLALGSDINPNDSVFLAYRSWFDICIGRPAEALGWLDRAVRLNPHLPGWYWELRGLALYHLRRYEEAANAFERIPAGPPWYDRFRAACYAQLGRLAEARASAAEALRKDAAFTLRGFAVVEPYKSQADLDHMIDGLRKAGLPE
jgi:adenylate cyclase